MVADSYWRSFNYSRITYGRPISLIVVVQELEAAQQEASTSKRVASEEKQQGVLKSRALDELRERVKRVEAEKLETARHSHEFEIRVKGK